ncbi:uncharacterized protein LOC112452580 [Temnothorax curvispinosus]|uniref:Uncharacterized protein LOC112452580 n=1 Tax=Temnothorax curvispinosus TaxID=300111 RepID=A0A6J1PGS1_9HYME|nr:uncharacterized protein LOC112452580 [Temnothorax curvispinosus]XP_024868634.1 uncharacterized protein LOC112452580 [Temnothorax curvispinosus]
MNIRVKNVEENEINLGVILHNDDTGITNNYKNKKQTNEIKLYNNLQDNSEMNETEDRKILDGHNKRRVLQNYKESGKSNKQFNNIQDRSQFLLDAFNRAFYKNLSYNENSSKQLICNDRKNKSETITEPEVCSYFRCMRQFMATRHF